MRPLKSANEERQELTRLRRENPILREEREMLSKAAAWFATETLTFAVRSYYKT